LNHTGTTGENKKHSHVNNKLIANRVTLALRRFYDGLGFWVIVGVDRVARHREATNCVLVGHGYVARVIGAGTLFLVREGEGRRERRGEEGRGREGERPQTAFL
jgi:hypothetical protein